MQLEDIEDGRPRRTSIHEDPVGVRRSLQEPGRDACIWIAIAVLTIAFQVMTYFASGNSCSAVRSESDSRPVLVLSKPVYFAATLGDSLGVWTTAVLLGIVLDHRGRFREESLLHVWTRRWAVSYTLCDMFFLVHEACVGCSNSAGSVERLLQDISTTLQLVTIVFHSWMIVLKFHDLGQLVRARVCDVLLAVFIGFSVLSILMFRVHYFIDKWNGSAEEGVVNEWASFLSLVSWLAYAIFLVTAVWGIQMAAWAAAASISDLDESERAAAQKVVLWARLVAGATALSGVFTLVHGVSIVHSIREESLESLWAVILTNVLYVCTHALNCVQVALLSSLVGPIGLRHSAEEGFVEVARLGGYALGDARRITFEGQVSELSGVCIVSFPGVYADLWSQVTRLQRQQASVACVFLPSVVSGLGLHSPDPENPQNPCYCSVIYPPFEATSYLRIVLKREGLEQCAEYQEQLAFERADAAAQGICLLVEADHPGCLWKNVKRRGLRRAQHLCLQNRCRAPWGCLWFSRWVENVERAVELNQELIVFYKRGAAGHGRVSWDELTDVHKVAAAEARSGLGASQRVEVAYLDRMGYSYTELDVTEFVDQFGDTDSDDRAYGI